MEKWKGSGGKERRWQMMSEHKCLFMLMEWGRDSHSALMVLRSNLPAAKCRSTEESKTPGHERWLKHFYSRPASQAQKTGQRQQRYLIFRENSFDKFLPWDSWEKMTGVKRGVGPVFFPFQGQPKELLSKYPLRPPPPTTTTITSTEPSVPSLLPWGQSIWIL